MEGPRDKKTNLWMIPISQPFPTALQATLEEAIALQH